MLSGAGSIVVRSLSLTGNSTRNEELVFPLCVGSFELTFEDSLQEAKCLVNGVKQITSAAITESIASFNMTFEKIDFNTLGFAYDELPQDSPDVPFPVVKEVVVPSGGVINDADITATTSASVLVYSNGGGVNGGTFLTKSATAPTANQFQVATGTLTLNAAQVGRTITYSVVKSYTSVPTIGVGSSADTFGPIEFVGIAYTPEGGRYGIRIPRLLRVGSPSFAITGELATLELPFRAAVQPGDRKPYKLYNLTGQI